MKNLVYQILFRVKLPLVKTIEEILEAGVEVEAEAGVEAEAEAGVEAGAGAVKAEVTLAETKTNLTVKVVSIVEIRKVVLVITVKMIIESKVTEQVLTQKQNM
jgi:hypothetical protein